MAAISPADNLFFPELTGGVNENPLNEVRSVKCVKPSDFTAVIHTLSSLLQYRSVCIVDVPLCKSSSYALIAIGPSFITSLFTTNAASARPLVACTVHVKKCTPFDWHMKCPEYLLYWFAILI